ncbi:signal recognition particle, subunit Srp54 [Heterobasidion irregulare TC 32-1]|uniref:Signal recognition particle 54 kDa protein n=1 Tax=Heterobasidion irregulare (strain TC 32-1) TaxID=747525 RepID=W4KJK9_HETIT|nr:signal recognition particle, subunit Srp54 [Heterobasidion irregulare TC 32-1]ETW85879.1 signal recognition particle, subunit Srp54 [Heterobasidion irregulare TC 32-1]
MVLADLGRKLNAALSSFNRAPVVDEKALDALLKEVCNALLETDVNVKLVAQLRSKVKVKVKASLESSGEKVKETNRKNVVQKAVFDELVHLVDPGVEPYKPKKGHPNVIMAGNGKTTTCTKLAVHYQKRGFKSCIVCADTFRAGAFDQTRQSATKAKVAYFGSYTETDPVAIAAQGVAKFKKEKFEVIIVDTSGRHKQEGELFEEMVQIGNAVKPDMTVLILDASIGQAAEAQSRAFKDSADFGAIIVTKMDGHAKGGGAISAVAATRTPIIFLGTGEHLTDLDRFSPQPFISKLLGLGDVQGLMEHMQDLATQNPDRQKEMAKKLEEGKLSIRDWREQIQNVMNLGPMSKIASMIPGLPQEMLQGSDEEGASRMKRMIYITDSMTSAELDSDGTLFMEVGKDGKPVGLTWRVTRVARGSGTSVREVEELLCQYRMMANMAKQAGGKNGWMQAMQKMQSAAGGRGRGAGGMPTPAQIQAMQRAMPPGMVQQMQRQMRSGGGLQEMMKTLMQSQGGDQMDMEEMQRMMSQMGSGMGGLGALGGLGGGMPGMADMFKMMGMGGGGGGGGR